MANKKKKKEKKLKEKVDANPNDFQKPPVLPPMDRYLTVRISDKMYAEYMAMTHRLGTTVSSYTRELIEEVVKKKKAG